MSLRSRVTHETMMVSCECDKFMPMRAELPVAVVEDVNWCPACQGVLTVRQYSRRMPRIQLMPLDM